MEGGKFIREFNCDQVAKEMIDGRGRKFRDSDEWPKMDKPPSKSFVAPSHISEADRMVINLMNEEEENKNYFSNKVDLLIRSRKR
jgi:hypothetical protein